MKKKEFRYFYYFGYKPISYATWGLFLWATMDIIKINPLPSVELLMIIGGIIGLLVGLYYYLKAE